MYVIILPFVLNYFMYCIFFLFSFFQMCKPGAQEVLQQACQEWERGAGAAALFVCVFGAILLCVSNLFDLLSGGEWTGKAAVAALRGVCGNLNCSARTGIF